MLWCILCVVMYFIYCDVFYILWCILCIVMCMNSRCIGPVVSGGTCVGLMYKFLSALLRLMQHLTLHCIYTCRLGAVHPTSCPALQVQCMYTHDAIHILPWVWCKDGSCVYPGIMSYSAVSHMICMSYIYVICCSQLYVMLLVSCELTHLHTSCKSF